METIINRGNTDNFRGADWYLNDHDRYKYNIPRVTVGGAGGIGSWAVLHLAMAGYRFNVFDYDIVESHNTGSQFFNKERSIGSLKINALKKAITPFVSSDVISSSNIINSRLDAYHLHLVSNHFIAAFDNMEARKLAFYEWTIKSTSNTNSIFIDGRLGPDFFNIYVVTNAEQADKYRETLEFNDAGTEEEMRSCNLTQTMGMASMIGNSITQIYQNFIANILQEEDIYTIPYKLRFSQAMLKYDIEL